MVLTVKVQLQDAERVKRALERDGRFARGYRYVKEDGFIYFPVSERFDAPYEFEERDVPASHEAKSLKEELAGTLTEDELAELRRSMDIVGSIAVIEVPERLVPKERVVAEAVLRRNPSVRTVVKKLGGHEGELRLQRYATLAGEETRETVVKENGVRLKIDLEGVYYSVRTATERKRVSDQVGVGERVLVMFSGAGPYVCVLAKHHPDADVTGIELNERGHELAVENARLNKLANVTLIQGDVRDVVPELAVRGVAFDRIIMPLPHTGADFLDEAFSVAKDGTVIHLYDFEREGEFERAAEKLRAGAARNNRAVEILDVVACGQHAPRVFRVCVDGRIV